MSTLELTTPNVAIALLNHLSDAVNAKDAFVRLLDRCHAMTQASAAAVLRRHTHRPGFEVLLTLGKPVRKEYLFATTLENESITDPEVSHDPESLLFQQTRASANLALERQDGVVTAVIHLEWSDPAVMALATLKDLRDALPYLTPFLEHLRRYDSRITIHPVSRDLGPDLDHELDIPEPLSLFRRLYGVLSTSFKISGAAFALGDVQELVVDPDLHFGKIDPLPESLPRESFRHVHEAMSELHRTSDRGHLVYPISFVGHSIGAAILVPPPGGLSEPVQEEISRVLQAASVYIQKALLFRKTRAVGAPMLLVGVPRDVLELCESYAAAMAPVLVRGETGTGKESIARFIHLASPRRNAPFLPFSCAELVENLAESQLFGHMRGAFTGAATDTVGIFEQAHGGTLFLDEIHLLTPPMQAKFLRAIESGEIRPVGSSGAPKRPDVRIVVATNRDLGQMVSDGTFLHDLYMRLDVLEVVLPGLRQNRQVILRIAAVLLNEIAGRNRKKIDGFTPRAKQALFMYDYPGNIRELRNILEKAVVITRANVIDLDSLPKKLVESKGAADAVPPMLGPGAEELFDPDYEAFRTSTERGYLTKLLETCTGNITEAARVSGLHRTHIYNLMKKHEFNSRQFKK